MADRIEAYIESTRLVRDAEQLKSLFPMEIVREGFENAVFASTIKKRLDYIARDELPAGNLDADRDRRDTIQLALRHVQVAREPFGWPDAVARLDLAHKQVTRKQYAAMPEYRETGARGGGQQHLRANTPLGIPLVVAKHR